MENRNLAYIYFSGHNFEEIINVLEMYEVKEVRKVNTNILEVMIPNDFDLESINHARKVIMGELLQDVTVVILPKNFNFNTDRLLSSISKLNFGVYQIEDLIYEIVKHNDLDVLEKLKNYYYNRFSPETIETILGFIDQDLNASKTAKALYMHRNTLNYRLDNFIEKSGINVRKFRGALAIYLLFKF